MTHWMPTPFLRKNAELAHKHHPLASVGAWLQAPPRYATLWVLECIRGPSALQVGNSPVHS